MAADGGPAVCVWGWIGVSFCCICIALGMAELTSAYPTSGGMYFWMVSHRHTHTHTYAKHISVPLMP